MPLVYDNYVIRSISRRWHCSLGGDFFFFRQSVFTGGGLELKLLF